MIKVLVNRNTVEKLLEIIQSKLKYEVSIADQIKMNKWIYEIEIELKKTLSTLGINNKRYYIFCNGRWLEKGFNTIQGCISYIRRNKIHNCSIYDYYIFVKNWGKQTDEGFIKEFR